MSEIKEKVVVVSVYDDPRIGNEDLDELELLVETAGGIVVGRLTQRSKHLDSRFLIGKGKIEELKEIFEQQEAETIIFDNELKPNQIRNINNEIPGCKVIDRSGLILDIFAARAHTAEAKVQVQLAQLEYMLPRLSGLWKHLERQRGGIGMRGPGETQLESDKRVIKNRITELKKKLVKLESQRKIRRSKRYSQKRIALVGYTNAGKSTLLNNLTGAHTYVEDMLFATLDPTTRRVVDSRGFISQEKSVLLLTDTVGFIKKLPHDLVESFKSTLGEAAEADILAIVADISHEALFEHIETVRSILKEINLHEKNSILILNKVDKIDDSHRKAIQRKFPNSIMISAQSEDGINYLKNKLFEMLIDGIDSSRIKLTNSSLKLDPKD